MALHSSTDPLPGRLEGADPELHTYAATLTAAGWTPATHTARKVGAQLDDHARRGGWPAVATWLDRLDITPDTGQDATVIDLSTRRR